MRVECRLHVVRLRGIELVWWCVERFVMGLVFDDVLEQTSCVSAGAVWWFGDGGGRSGERVPVRRSIAVLVFDERHFVRAG